MPAAISISPSLNWAGNDGNWSSFRVMLGSQAQELELLAATSSEVIWAPYLKGACIDSPFSEDICSIERGGLYDPNISATWRQKGQYALPFEPESPLGGNTTASKALWGVGGLDIAAVGYGNAVLDQQPVLTYAVNTPYVGLLGLKSRPHNWTDTDRSASPLGTLINENKVPGQYWAFTQGAKYLDVPSFASLTFGGYDAERGNGAGSLTVPLNAENNRDLLVAIDRINIDTRSGDVESHISALPSGIYAFIDSVVPELWMPESTCQYFESAFGILWNDVYQMYIVNETQHDHLTSMKASVTLSLGVPGGQSAAETIDIVLPYAAFDLEASYPLAGIQDTSSVYYFPLKKATSDDQYFLGRTFLQEAYVAVDYDRSEFYISQAVHTSESDVRAIYPPGQNPVFNKGTTAPKPDPGLSKGAIAGIAIGAGLLVVLILAAIIFLVRRKRKQRPKSVQTWQTSESGLTDLTDYYGTKEKHDMDESEKRGTELDASTTGRGSVISNRHEMESPPLGGRAGSYEFPSQPPMSPREMESPPLGTPGFSPPAPASPQSHRSASSGEIPTELAGYRYVTRSRQELAGSGENVRDVGGYFGSLS